MIKHEINLEDDQAGLMMMLWQKRAFQILLLLCTTSLLLVLFLLYDYQQQKKHQIETAKNRIQQETLMAVQHIDKTLNSFLSIASDIATEISTGQLARSQIKARLKKTMETTPELFGIGVAYIPYMNDPKSRRQSSDYITRPNSFDKVEDFDTLSVPCFYRFANPQHHMPKCVVFVEYILKDIMAGISTLDLGQTGYQFILSKEGVFINHPIEKYVKNRQAIFEVAENQKEQVFKQLGQHAINSDSGMIDYIDSLTKQPTWLLYEPIPATGWLMSTLVYQNELFNKSALTPKLLRISLWFMIFLAFFFAILFRAYKGETDNLWMLSIIISLLLIIEIVFVYKISLPPLLNQAERVITIEKANLHQFLTSQSKKTALPQTETHYIPTKVTIESIAFSGNKQVSISGEISQKYDQNSDHSLTYGFIFPEATSFKINSSSYDKETQRYHWDFQAALPQNIDDSNYPLDNRELNIHIQPHQANKPNVQLLPDLEAYKAINPHLLPGIQPKVLLSDWHLMSSFFNYRIADQDKAEKAQPISKLYFTILMQREFIKPFLTSILPILVVVGLLFALQLLLGQVNSFANVIAPLVALLFGNLFAQMAVRKSLNVIGLSYIDYYYIVMYLAIFGVAITYYLYHSHKEMILITHRQGLIAKLLFWPLILASLLSLTIWTF
jgi:hypothetical protein